MDPKALTIRPFLESDRAIVSPWYKNGLMESDYIGDGFVVARDQEIMAVGFLIKTRTKLAIYEFMQTNPVATSYIRAKATLLLTRHILGEAQRAGFGVLLGYTPPGVSRGLLKMYDRIGCSLSPGHTIVARRLDTWV
jgi:hypothetical protein